VVNRGCNLFGWIFYKRRQEVVEETEPELDLGLTTTVVTGFKFSKRSLDARKELHPNLQLIVDEAIKQIDFVILDAQRGRAEQEQAFKLGNTKAHFGQSAHNYIPAVAMDIVPYPIDFDNVDKFKAIAQVFLTIAKARKIPIRWGADWNMNDKTSDESFLDWGHFELHPWRDWAKQGRLIDE